MARACIIAIVSLGVVSLVACTHSVTGSGTGTGSSSGLTSSSSGNTSSSSGGSSGGASVPLQAGPLCKKLEECGELGALGPGACAAKFAALRVSTTCANKVPSATCETLDALEAECFPACALGTPSVCDADGTITICSESERTGGGESITVACNQLCSADGKAYSGTCGEAGPNGEPSDNGMAKCWCR